ncbi:hypothetical protein C0991_000763 [Blastosporella zonata]|nr:hypothetical protein C0991_000763 [Blastosporella zonata]
MQSDPEASIRTNTCILIGRLGPTLGYHTKKKVLVPAFSRAIRDTFVHARVAGLMAFMATIDCFEAEDVANKVIPNIAFAMIDKENALSEPPTPGGSGAPPEPATLVTTAAGAAGSLAGWAISSFGKKARSRLFRICNHLLNLEQLITSDLQTAIGVPETTERPTSAPPRVGNDRNTLYNTSLSITQTISASASPLSSPPVQSVSRAKGMQLGANKVPLSTTATILAEQWADDTADSASTENPWGSDDLIDINADEEDWSAFETAPTPKPVAPMPITPAGQWPGGVGNGVHSHNAHLVSQRPDPLSRQPTPVSSLAQTQTTKSPPRDQKVNGRAPEHLPSPVPTTMTPSMSDLTKEDKVAEMARRKEERKQRIALLKEQKKSAARI